ncbi:hypothetical protein HAX54_027937 [Datura stramonium]|uniref:Uncharacterized protein n=1 Tax=Datura stramonium TaxID=4076 RepID=A0ABS8V6H9_DATST|nr:hypothetical protein [Datura stramonium]
MHADKAKTRQQEDATASRAVPPRQGITIALPRQRDMLPTRAVCRLRNGVGSNGRKSARRGHGKAGRARQRATLCVCRTQRRATPMPRMRATQQEGTASARPAQCHSRPPA